MCAIKEHTMVTQIFTRVYAHPLPQNRGFQLHIDKLVIVKGSYLPVYFDL